MKHARLALFLAPLVLVACSGNTATISLEDTLRNPLFAQLYYTDLSEQMVTLDVASDPLLQDTGKKAIVDRTREQAVERVQDAIALRQSGKYGEFISERSLVLGTALMVNGSVFFSPDFISTPGPSLHVYLSGTVDPRQGDFPQSGDIDLGLLSNPYGAQEYVIPEKKTLENIRSLVIWDSALGMPYGFVQF